MWNIESHRVLSHEILDYLREGHFLPREVLKLMDQCFSWEKEEVLEYYDNAFIKYLSEQLGENIVPGYEYLHPEANRELEDYIEHRERGYICFLDKDYEGAFDYFKKAYELNQEDPYLQCIYGVLILYWDYDKSGKKIIQKGIQSALDQNKMNLFCGQILYSLGNNRTALQYFRKIPRNTAYYPGALRGTAECLLKMQRYFSCGRMLRRNLRNKRTVEAARGCLKDIYGILYTQNQSNPEKWEVRYQLFRLYPYISGSRRRNPHALKRNEYKSLLHKIMLIILMIISVIIVIAAIAASKLVLLIGVLYYIIKSKKKKS